MVLCVRLIFFADDLVLFFEGLDSSYRTSPHIEIFLMGGLIVVMPKPFVQILLKFFHTGVEFLSQSQGEEFLLDPSC